MSFIQHQRFNSSISVLLPCPSAVFLTHASCTHRQAAADAFLSAVKRKGKNKDKKTSREKKSKGTDTK